MGLNIVWLGDLGFPVGLANIQKLILVINSMRPYGVNGTVINRFGIHKRKSGLDIKTEGVYKGIKYIHASGYPYRPRNIFMRNILKVWGMINEVYLLYKLHKNGQVNAAILQTDRFTRIIFYRIVSKLLGIPLLMLYVELYSSITTRRGIWDKIDGFLYEKFGFFLVDGIMPISDYLIDIVKNRNPKLPIMKVPLITDFDRFNIVERSRNEKYFLFCGAAGYLEIIIFILKAFEQMHSEGFWLYLVCNGTPAQMSRLKEEIAKNGKSSLIKIYSGISDNQLTELYANACGLLIPLRPTIQDTARFPHKIGEYIASGNPIVSTNYGEVAKYFEDGKSALIAREYDVEEFAEKMKFIILNPEKAKEIGQKGRQVGIDNFDYKQYGLKIKEFIELIISRKNNQSIDRET